VTRWPARRRPQVEPPEPLVRFVPSEWPGGLWDGFAAWKAARRGWMDEHYPSPGAIGPLGDRLDLLLFERDTRRSLLGW
jgi:hypothetical protein